MTMVRRRAALVLLVAAAGCASVTRVPVQPAEYPGLAERLNREAAGKPMRLTAADPQPVLPLAVTIDALDTERVVYKDLERRDHSVPLAAVREIRVPGDYGRRGALVGGLIAGVAVAILIALQDPRPDQEIPNWIVGPVLGIPAGFAGAFVGLKLGELGQRDTVYELPR
jgi:hypothetical protein